MQDDGYALCDIFSILDIENMNMNLQSITCIVIHHGSVGRYVLCLEVDRQSFGADSNRALSTHGNRSQVKLIICILIVNCSHSSLEKRLARFNFGSTAANAYNASICIFFPLQMVKCVRE